MHKFFPRALSFSRKIDTFNGWIGKASSFLALPLMVLVLFEVIMRYAFNKPTIWAWDVNIQLSCVIVCACAAYTLYAGGFVVVDILVARFPARRRAIIDLFLFFPLLFSMIMILYTGWFDTYNSVLIRQKLSTVWRPIIYPLYIVGFISCILLLLQVFSKLIKDLDIIFGEKKCQ